MPPLEIRYTRIRDESRLDLDGTVIPEKVVQAHIGTFGPFIERFPAAGFTMDQVKTRFEQLRRELEGLTQAP